MSHRGHATREFGTAPTDGIVVDTNFATLVDWESPGKADQTWDHLCVCVVNKSASNSVLADLTPSEYPPYEDEAWSVTVPPLSQRTFVVEDVYDDTQFRLRAKALSGTALVDFQVTVKRTY